jgi:hypothetical protein
MKRKRGLADAVLWPQESEEAELLTLYQTILSPEETRAEGDEDLRLADRPDLVASDIGPGVLRVASKGGGCSVLVAKSTDPGVPLSLLDSGDAALIVMGARERFHGAGTIPISLLPDTSLWPEYVLPE